VVIGCPTDENATRNGWRSRFGPRLAVQSVVPLAKLILIVDDEEDARDLLQLLLERSGFEVRAAADGGEAIEALRSSRRPDAVVTDLMMPGLVGQELVEFMRSSDSFATIPIAVVSAEPELAPANCKVFAKPLVFDKLLRFLCTRTRA
jgi:CheY-like chemotaxis protein